MNRAIPIIASLPLAFTMAADAGQVLHDGPWTYLFGTHLDTHQESKLNKDGTLKGRLYVIFTEDEDPESGLPIARHPRGAGQNEECGVDPIDCVVGWNFTAKPGSAKFLYHQGVNGDDHPVEQARSAAHEVFMAERNRVERARVHCGYRHRKSP